MVRCWTVQLQARRVKIQLQRIVNVPRISGVRTKFAPCTGAEQFGVKVVEAAAVGIKRTTKPEAMRCEVIM